MSKNKMIRTLTLILLLLLVGCNEKPDNQKEEKSIKGKGYWVEINRKSEKQKSEPVMIKFRVSLDMTKSDIVITDKDGAFVESLKYSFKENNFTIIYENNLGDKLHKIIDLLRLNSYSDINNTTVKVSLIKDTPATNP